ncbi:hypothetical protein U9M48_040766 [Paspalum notatum var. saurae]|uniref:Uncharacterized protein n=1 Tax=Paspalum notatum var. saurae TaxID=547442 RepID=A0AAQ3UR86_PASNO
MAPTAILRGVPSELKAMLDVKKTTKKAWEAVNVMCVRENRVKAANCQCLLKELENLQFKDRESIDGFAVRVNTLVGGLRELGEELCRRFLEANRMAIEMLLNLDAMSMEELIGRLRIVEDAKAKEVAAEGIGQLMLTEA